MLTNGMAWNVYSAMAPQLQGLPESEPGTPAEYYDGSESEDEIEDETYDCPRFNEIRNFLVANRGPTLLALDTMRILSLPVFYRYIRELDGPLNLSSLEIRNFLGVCNQERTLYLFKPFPGVGTVYRIDTSWPQFPQGFQAPIPRPRTNIQDAECRWLNAWLMDPNVRLDIYQYAGEARDLDMEML